MKPEATQSVQEDAVVDEPAGTAVVQSVETAQGRTYTVVPGDTLVIISNKVYGKNVWRKIYQANKDRLSDPTQLYPGLVLTIPEE